MFKNHHGLKKIKISDQQLKPSVKIDYNPDKGIIVETGYFQEENKIFIPIEELNTTPDGDYAKVGDTFYPLSKELDPEIKNLFDVRKLTIPIDKIPEFFKRDLVLLKTKLKAVLTDNAANIKIIEEPFKQRVQVCTRGLDWLEFKVGYIAGEYELPHDIFKKTKEKYIRVNDIHGYAEMMRL